MSRSATPAPGPLAHGPAADGRAKRLFVLPCFAFLGLVLVHSAVRLVATGGAFVWWGPALVAGSFLGFLGWMVTSRAARTRAVPPGVVAGGALGLLVAVAGAAWGDAASALPLAYAFAGFGAVLAYLFWYSRLGRTPSPRLVPGAILPDFSLEDEAGRPVASAEFRGSPAVFLFYRGNWCPLCMAQIREVADLYKELDARGARVALVSPQPHGRTRELAAKLDVPFRFLVDPEGRAARALGILHAGGVPAGLPGYAADTVLPTVVVTDAEGRILLADESDNYRVRPEPSTFIDVLDRGWA